MITEEDDNLLFVEACLILQPRYPPSIILLLSQSGLLAAYLEWRQKEGEGIRGFLHFAGQLTRDGKPADALLPAFDELWMDRYASRQRAY